MSVLLHSRHALTQPLRLEPEPFARIWGVPDLQPWAEGAHGAEATGEAWFTHAAACSRLGPLAELAAADPLLFGRPEGQANCPLLVKILRASRPLSVQVHPDHAYAATLGAGLRGKPEAWIILDAEPHARIALGLSMPMSREAVAEAALDGSIAQRLAWFTPVAGQVIDIPAGTIHALGEGCTVLEVQAPSDITYRLFDWGSGRELHLEQALSVARLGPAPRLPFTPPPATATQPLVTALETPDFTLLRFAARAGSRFTLTKSPDTAALWAQHRGLTRLDAQALPPATLHWLPGGLTEAIVTVEEAGEAWLAVPAGQALPQIV